MPQTVIHEPSVKSLFLEMRFAGTSLSTGTGFCVKKSGRVFLITNRHNVTGRHQETDAPLSKTLGVPDEIVILHHRSGQLGNRTLCTEALFSADKPRWIEHPSLGNKADFIALPLEQLVDVEIYPYDVFGVDPDILIGPADVVSVVGFPFGLLHAQSLAVWATGFVASEPDLDYQNLPIFLIDCRSRQGQSGSPVIFYKSVGPVSLSDGSSAFFGGPVTKFLGIYSGRVRSDSDLGIVWKARAVAELVSHL